MSKSTEISKLVHYTYMIKHINGKFYVGRHSTRYDPWKCPYMGSGKWVRSIKDKSTLTKYIIAIYDTYEQLKEAEFLLISEHFDHELNMNYVRSSDGLGSGEDNFNFGKTYSLEHRKNISISQTGKIISEETKQRLRDANIGKKHNEESKRKNSIASSGRKHTQESIQKMSLAKQNISEETKRKMSLAKQNISEETKRKMSLAKQNISEETRRKSSISATGRKHTDETKKKLSMIQIGKTLSEVTKQKMLISKQNRSDEAKQNTSIKLSKAHRGSNNHAAILIESQVIEIKIRLANGDRNIDIARYYGVKSYVISNIKIGKTWKHVII